MHRTMHIDDRQGKRKLESERIFEGGRAGLDETGTYHIEINQVPIAAQVMTREIGIGRTKTKKGRDIVVSSTFSLEEVGMAAMNVVYGLAGQGVKSTIGGDLQVVIVPTRDPAGPAGGWLSNRWNNMLGRQRGRTLTPAPVRS